MEILSRGKSVIESRAKHKSAELATTGSSGLLRDKLVVSVEWPVFLMSQNLVTTLWLLFLLS